MRTKHQVRQCDMRGTAITTQYDMDNVFYSRYEAAFDVDTVRGSEGWVGEIMSSRRY